MNNLEILEVEKIIGYSFKNKDLLVQAFTHSSYANEKGTVDYERLEFLGDSILETITSLYLFNHFKGREGQLSKIRAKVVSAQSLSKAVHSMDLSKYIKVGGSIDYKNIPLNIVADVFESIVAGIYLDSNSCEIVNNFVVNCLLISEQNIINIYNSLMDYKTLLQEKLQAVGKMAEYNSEEVKDGNNLLFLIRLVIDNKVVATATAVNKKQAEQACAKSILEKNGGIF